MTGNEIKVLAQKRVKSTNTGVDWAGLFKIVMDEIFTKKQWRFARQTLNYIHSGSTFLKTFSDTSTELSLTKILNVTLTTSYTIVGGVPIPNSSTGADLVYYPYHDFLHDFPDQTEVGDTSYFTIVSEGDGITGMQIGLYPMPSSDAAVWVYGNFKPSYVIDDNPLQILPPQFHRIVLDGLIRYAAEEVELDKLAVSAERRFYLGISELDEWDRKNHAYFPIRKPYTVAARKGPIFPSNYPNVTR